MAVVRIPLNFFGMSFGLTGLALCWLTAGHEGLAPMRVADVLLALAAAVWLATVLVYLDYARSVPGAFRADLLDAVASPFGSLAVIVPMVLAASGIAPHVPQAGRVLVDVFLVLTVLSASWFVGQWIYGPLDVNQLHPGYYLPTVAGGCLAAVSAADVGQRGLAEVMLGLGVVSWLFYGSVVTSRLFIRPPLPTALTPTLAIEVAPAGVVSLAYFALHGDHIDPFISAVAGYGLLMVLAQIRLLPAYRQLTFGPATWAFTFAWAAVASTALHWIHATKPPGQRLYAYLVLAGISLLIIIIAARTLLAATRRQLLPPRPHPV